MEGLLDSQLYLKKKNKRHYHLIAIDQSIKINQSFNQIDHELCTGNGRSEHRYASLGNPVQRWHHVDKRIAVI